MTRLSRYIFEEAMRPFLFFVVILTAIVWLSQSLRYVNLIVEQGQSAGMFIYLIVLMLPSLLIFVLPAALAIAVCYALFRLQTDSELVVIAASGRSRFTVALPLLGVAAVVALMQLAVVLYLMPVGLRTLKDRVFEIRGDLVTTVLREGQFTTPSDSLTVYVRERTGSSSARGILVHDSRDPERPTTYMAEEGEIVTSEAGPRFVLVNGNVQRMEAPGRISTLQFERYVVDLAPFQRGDRTENRGAQERYLGELLDPPDRATLNQQKINSFNAEAHDRLSSPLYSFAFVLIAAAAMLGAGSARRSIGLRIGLTALLCLVLRMAGLGVRGLVTDDPGFAVLLYLIPVIGIAGALIWLSGWIPSRAPLPPPPEGAAA